MTRPPSSRPRRPAAPWILGAIALATALTAGVASAGEARTRVILNGVATPVVFNDGDSFRVLSGPMSGAKARLSGFNTLESHGPVHQWGTWTEKELYILAKMATYHARDNVWECTTDGKTDGYGRMLVLCPELAREQIRKGFAHAMTVSDEPSAPELLAAQREAMVNRRGIWAHGIPDYVLTSLHSIEEDTEGKPVYNRLVSTVDGHSVKWQHRDKYDECAKVCHRVFTVDEAKVDEVVARLQREQSALVSDLDAAALRGVIREFARHHHVSTPVPEAKQEPLQALLVGWAAQGAFGPQEAGTTESCMTHVDFKRRYGAARAQCLR